MVVRLKGWILLIESQIVCCFSTKLKRELASHDGSLGTPVPTNMRLTHTPYLGAYEHVGIKKVETTYTIERESRN